MELGSIQRSAGRLAESYVFLFILAMIIAIVLFRVLVVVPSVGVIIIDSDIMTDKVKDDIVDMLRYAGEEKDIKGVVLSINSPGGEVSRIEEIYLEILKLRNKKPVVASIDGIGLSGGYYISAAANLIYAKPSSQVGNIGVVSVLPEPVRIDRERVTTGPYKTTGRSQKYYVGEVEMVKEAFLRAVISQRGDRLKIDKENLSKAEIYLGIEGMRIGLVDRIGTRSDALEGAADLARIANYGIVDVNKKMNITLHSFPQLLSSNESTPVNYYRYVEFYEGLD